MNSITQQCKGCLRVFALPMYSETDGQMGQMPVTNEYLLTCVCGTTNTFPLMWVSKFPLKAEVPV